MADSLPKWMLRLRENIKSSMYRYTLEDDYKYFITHEDLIAAWYQEIDGETPWASLRQEVEYLSGISDQAFNNEWIRVVSVLVWIQYSGWLEFLQSSIDIRWDKAGPDLNTNSNSSVPQNLSAAFRDEHLPFTKNELQRHLFRDSETEIEVAIKFFEAQFAFKPICLKQNELLSFDDERYRLPIKQEEDVNDKGAYGLVAKVRVSGKYFFYKSDISQDFEPYISDFNAARKEFEIDYDFAREQKNLEILKATDMQHSRVMQSFASVIIGQKYNLFFPWADLDLQRFLNGEFLEGCHPDIITPYAIMKEALELLDALKFLHESIQINGDDVVFSHLDLKPNNILVIKDNDSSRYPLGKWKITDFGISSTEPRQDDSSRLVSAQQLLERSHHPDSKQATLIEIERYPGPYQPPEAEKSIAKLFRKSDISTPGHKSDIWSYGCILLSVLAFAIGGNRYTEIMSEKRLEGGACPDGKWRKGYFYKGAADKKFQINPHIQVWFEEDIARRAAWAAELWKIVADKMLQIYPYERSSAKDISTMVKTLVDDQLPRKNVWSGASNDPPAPTPDRVSIPERPKPQPSTDVPTSQAPPEIRTSEPRVDQPVSEPLTESDLEFPLGKLVELDIKQANYVRVSSDGSSVLYRTAKGAVAVPGSTANGIATFNTQNIRTLPEKGQVSWNQVDISGDYVVLRKAPNGHDQGKVEVYCLSDDSPQEQARWTNQVMNELVNGICVSVHGCLAVRYSKSVSLFSSSGDAIHAELSDTLTKLQDGVKDIAFDRSGQIFIAVLSDHWLMKNLAEDSGPILVKHGIRRPDHGYFVPSAIPFTRMTAFLLHDAADPVRCLAILPGLDGQSPFRQYQFDLTDSPDALVVTPDNKRLIYVTSRKQRFPTKYTYCLRSRSIDLEARNPVSTSDLWEAEMFKVSEKLDIGIAAVNAAAGYTVLVADTSGFVHGFAAK